MEKETDPSNQKHEKHKPSGKVRKKDKLQKPEIQGKKKRKEKQERLTSRKNRQKRKDNEIPSASRNKKKDKHRSPKNSPASDPKRKKRSKKPRQKSHEVTKESAKVNQQGQLLSINENRRISSNQLDRDYFKTENQKTHPKSIYLFYDYKTDAQIDQKYANKEKGNPEALQESEGLVEKKGDKKENDDNGPTVFEEVERARPAKSKFRKSKRIAELQAIIRIHEKPEYTAKEESESTQSSDFASPNDNEKEAEVQDTDDVKKDKSNKNKKMRNGDVKKDVDLNQIPEELDANKVKPTILKKEDDNGNLEKLKEEKKEEAEPAIRTSPATPSTPASPSAPMSPTPTSTPLTPTLTTPSSPNPATPLTPSSATPNLSGSSFHFKQALMPLMESVSPGFLQTRQKEKEEEKR